MKKIIWVFGQSATGKKTLINNLTSYDRNTLNALNLNCKKIITCENTINDNSLVKPKVEDKFFYDDSVMQEDNAYFNRNVAVNRRSCIMTDTLSFLNSDADVLLIKGQDNDIWNGRGDIVKYFLSNFANNPSVSIEVYLLMVQDEELWKSRISKKEWYKKFTNKEEVMNNMLKAREEEKHEQMVLQGFDGLDIPITMIDSGEFCYTIIGDYGNKRRR